MEHKPHKPTARRLEQARERGEVVRSQDVVSVASYVVALIALWAASAWLMDGIQEMLLLAFSAEWMRAPADHVAGAIDVVRAWVLWTLLPIVAIAAAGAITGAFLQVGPLCSVRVLKPDAARINPGAGLARIFSARTMFSLGLILLKTVLVGGVVSILLWKTVPLALELGHATPAQVLDVAGRLVLFLAGSAATVFVLTGALDYANTRFQYMRDHRMSTDELRREFREVEGDPLNLGRRRSEHMEMIYASLLDRVNACALIVHAPGQAVGVQDVGGGEPALVIVRGVGPVADLVIRLAHHGLRPTREDPELARLLMAEVALDRPVPQHLSARVGQALQWAAGDATGAAHKHHDQAGPTAEEAAG